MKISKVREKVLGTEHKDTLVAKHDLAGTHLALGNIQEAVQILKEILPVLERIFEYDHAYSRNARTIVRLYCNDVISNYGGNLKS